MKHRDIINKMTLEEKAAFLSGKGEWNTRDIPRLNIPAVFCADGPHGIRKQAGAGDHLGLHESLPATCFPTAAATANSWDVNLAEEIGEALGKEAAASGVQVLLGPGLNIKRSPLCGRNFECFSEDPYLSGKMAASYIKGIQNQGVYACPKHFAVNNQELRRMTMNAVLDERTLREIYLTGFEIAVKKGNAKAIMTSYNQINGTYANENPHLLLEILRKDWGFDGIVLTDWGGSNDHVKGIQSRSNLEMPAPGLDSARQVLEAVKNEKLTMDELDICADDLLDAVFTLSEYKKSAKKTFNKLEHHKLARKAAQESAVLLKNSDHMLPLRPNTKVALIGDFAVNPRYQGAGSSMVNPTFIESMEKSIENYDLQVVGVARGYKRQGKDKGAILEKELEKEALELAGKADIVLYCFGLDEISETEGMDRMHMRIPQSQIHILHEITQVNKEIVGILSAGASVEMSWHTSCKAILHGYLAGQAGASALLDILTGKVNPSGRLAESYPVRYEDTPALRYFPSAERNAEYRESIYAGYRYYDTVKMQVQYPFGYGLSYTAFTYTDLKIEKDGVKAAVTNTGDMDGAEVVQLYVGLPNAVVFRPHRELKGFTKIFLKAGECREVNIPFDDKSFRYWNILTKRWEIEPGKYRIMLGASVEDIRLEGEIEVAGTTTEYPYNPALLPCYYTGTVQDISDSEFEKLLGHSIPSGKWEGKLGLNDAVCQMYYAKSGLARLAYRILTKRKLKNEENGKPDLNLLFQYNIPFRAIAKMTGGMVSMEMAQGIVTVVNGQFFKGMGKVIGGFFRNRKLNKQYEEKFLQKAGTTEHEKSL